MLATLLSRAQFGLEAPEVRIDVHVTSGLPAVSVVGLPQTAVKDSRDRVRSAILLVDTPGTGKSMLAQRLPGILPPLDESEALEIATICTLQQAVGQLQHTGTDIADPTRSGKLEPRPNDFLLSGDEADGRRAQS